MRQRVKGTAGVSNESLFVVLALIVSPAQDRSAIPFGRSRRMRKSRTNANPQSVVCHLTILAAAIPLPVLLTSCGKKNQEGETRTVQKGEDDFLDKDAKPDERKYLLAAKPFFVAVAHRKYTDAYALLSSHARARMSLDQFKPAQQDSDSQQNQSHAFDNVTAEQFAYLMQHVEGAHGTPRAPKMLAVLVEEGGELKVGYFEFLPPSMMD
jgi:hypothetical protein